MDRHDAATIRALALAELLKAALEDGAHSLTPSADFHAELERLIEEAKSNLAEEFSGD